MTVILKRCQIVVHLVHGSLSPLFSCHPLAFKPSLSHYGSEIGTLSDQFVYFLYGLLVNSNAKFLFPHCRTH